MQKLDTRLDQLSHRERTLPVVEQVNEATTRVNTLEEDVVLARTAVGDVEREITKADQDVQLVRDRATRTQQRLDAGQGSPKDLQGMEHELQTLARRQNELEEIELEVMERAEGLRSDLGAAENALAKARERVDELTAQRDAALEDIERERGEVDGQRAALPASLPEPLVALYERVRQQRGGQGAAPLMQRRCGGCQLELNQADLSRIRAAAEDEVLRCEECGRILVRTSESGL
ncbi:zinc ribbon domain-containing protein [Demetria terragena]|uniref:zinc ribbon domain-containing protein n=1 Tax=Demetria terragena TaxID=63959 RepID=UPI003CCB89DB